MSSSRIAAVVAVSLLVGATALAVAERVGPVVVDRPARRQVTLDPAAGCDLTTVRALSARHPDAGQLIVMATGGFGDTAGQVELAVRSSGGTWRCQHGPLPARFGRAGTRPLVDRRSGDGTTPAGVFALGVVDAWDGQRFSFFGNAPDPGVRGGYRAVRAEDCWGATPNSSRYQHLIARTGCAGPDEWLPRFGDVYAHAAVIGANLDPISGDAPGEIPYAAAIFLHRHSYTSGGATRPTSGCVSLALTDLIDTLRLIDPALDPHFAIGPVDWLRASA